MEKTNELIIAARVPKKLKELIQKFLERDTHMNESDLIRDAIREKIKREAPGLFEEVFSEAPSHEQA